VEWRNIIHTVRTYLLYVPVDHELGTVQPVRCTIGVRWHKKCDRRSVLRSHLYFCITYQLDVSSNLLPTMMMQTNTMSSFSSLRRTVLFLVVLNSVMAMRTVLVTGGNRGIGLAICQRLLEETSDVKVLLGSRDMGRGNQAAEFLEKQIGGDCKYRLEVVEMDTSSHASVTKAASDISAKHKSLYGIVNNAGVIDTPCINTNYFGPRRVNDALANVLQCPGGRIVNIASASGPNYVSRLPKGEVKSKLAEPWLIKGGIPELDEMAKSLIKTSDGYGTSKALLNAYTRLHAKAQPALIINSVTPGFIASDMGKTLGASNPTSAGAIPPVNLLLNQEYETIPTGRYYGSDTKRSPLNVYRGPGDPVYEGPDWEE
jgi:carbonyl reductase 1